MNDKFQILSELYFECFGSKPENYSIIKQAGSNRNYLRLIKGKKTVIGVYSDNIVETETFLYFTQVFKNCKLNVPEVFYVSSDKTSYLLEDLGDDLLLDIVLRENKKDGFNDYLIGLYKKAISALVEMQIKAASYIDFTKAYSISEFNTQSILFDLNYFKYYFLNRCGIAYDEKKLQDDFERFADILSSSGWKFFMFRDFQARNIIIKDSKAYFIDYQGGRKGAPEYDLASLLYQAKAAIPEDKKLELLDYYYEQFNSYVSIDKQSFYNRFYSYVYIRILQTLGAYGLRGIIEKKQHFIESIPFALENLKILLKNNPELTAFEEFDRVVNEIAGINVFENQIFSEFTVTVSSFSYKKGLPEDKTGNGGGFVFDCRGLDNPGRFTEYKNKTGKDKEVKDFFKKHPGIDDFVDNATKVVCPTIENYIERGFNSLMISFGCTGGQHRSVYCAEKMAKYIRNSYNIAVKLCHREIEAGE
ncbi:MAG: RNase adapter RapZ [Bacteroidales bacterium]|nr:RNase adapter RapZ [Bacteroidales bacterium]